MFGYVRLFQSLPKLLVLILGFAVLSGCYLPNKFTLTMQVAPDGRFSAAYDGTLTQLQFLQRIGSGELQGPQVDEYVTIYENDMRRSPSFKEVTYLGNAEYQVKYERQGSLTEDRQFSFPSRNGTIMGLRYWTAETAQDHLNRIRQTNPPAFNAIAEAGFLREPYIMEVFGDRLPAKIRQDLIANGFWIRGEIRIWTDARVAYSNADQVVQGSPSLYIWNIDDLNDNAPQMVMTWTPPNS